jgi:LPS-assembly protein
MILKADEIDYDQNREYAEARGNVRFRRLTTGEELEASRVEYNLEEETGKFYDVRGSAPAKLEARPGVLTTTSPFSFQGRWAERIKDRYILYDGFITNCKLPSPWWTLKGSQFDIIPGDRAIAKKSTFWLRKIPLFYTPMFYKSLERAPRKSGFLTPNFGNSSRRGLMFGGGYYWAINRSYDAAYRAQWFTQRGIAHHVDFRGKPAQKTDFNFILYGVNDRGPLLEDGTRGAPQSGYLLNFEGRTKLGHGFEGRADINYLSSFDFRQAFTESFYEAVYSEVHSVGYIRKAWSTYSVNMVGTRSENFNSTLPNDKVSLRRMPSIEFGSRDRRINERILPVWISFDSSFSLLRRNQLSYQTAQFVDRLDFEPRITTALRWKDFHVLPSFSIRETLYGSSFDAQGKVVGNNVRRSSREFAVDLIMPSFARIFESPPGWLGDRLKHVIEPRASFRHVSGIDNFRQLIRFDETESLSDTQEAEISLTNRLLAKRRDGRVDEVLSWTIAQRRFFDPDFGGAIVEGQRNVLLSSAALTGYTFLDRPRNYSPVVSYLRLNPIGGLGIEWRADYDPLRGRMVNSNLSVNGRLAKDYFVSVGHNQVRSVPVVRLPDGQAFGLAPSSNELFGMVGFGQENRRGWSAGFLTIYDYRQAVMKFAQTQVTYNTDCCGWSVQYRRFNFGNRDENQFRLAFAVANIGSFGTLKRQERMF